MPCFAKIAHTLHVLMRKDAVFDWNSDCQSAFEELKEQLTNLVYPQLDKAFQLETDTSGLFFPKSRKTGRIIPLPTPVEPYQWRRKQIIIGQADRRQNGGGGGELIAFICILITPS